MMKNTNKAILMGGALMRREIKKLEQPNIIVDSLDLPKYATTNITVFCNVNGPDCNEDGIDNNETWRSGWKDASDFKHHRGVYDEYDYHICPSCQETNCMKCFDGVLDPGGRCDNKDCEAHDNCGKCGEPYFQDMHGGAYCINPECDKNDEIKAKEAAAIKLASRRYWVTCDGPGNGSATYQKTPGDNSTFRHTDNIDEASPEIKNNPTLKRYCDAEGWDPEFDNQPKGWYRKDHGRDGEDTTDFCEDCCKKVCGDCEKPYDEFGVCKNKHCRSFNTGICPECDSETNRFGNCGSGMYDDCSHCKHCKEKLEQIDPDWRVDPICMTPGCIADENPWDNVFTKKAHYTYEDDPDYPDDPIELQHCDRPGCQEVRNLDNPVVFNPMERIETPDGGEKHYCSLHKDDEDICPSCGEITDKNYNNPDLNAFGHHPKCPVLKTCTECGSNKSIYGFCPYCTDLTDEGYEKSYSNAWGFGDSQ